MLCFNHSGNLGDIVFSLHFCKEVMQFKNEEKFDFNIKTNVNCKYSSFHPYKNVRMTKECAIMLQPLLEYQHYINKVYISDKTPEQCLDLDLFRKLNLNFSGGDIRSWYYALSSVHLQRNFFEKILFSPINKICENKIIVVNTHRYQNIYINYKLLKPFEQYLVFCGTREEYYDFKIKSGVECDHKEFKDFLEFASIVEGSKGLLGNQSGLYSIAECLKCPRILISPEFINYKRLGPCNNNPIGGWNEVASTNQKLISCVESLLSV
jgi:hypothetical protein